MASPGSVAAATAGLSGRDYLTPVELAGRLKAADARTGTGDDDAFPGYVTCHGHDCTSFSSPYPRLSQLLHPGTQNRRQRREDQDVRIVSYPLGLPDTGGGSGPRVVGEISGFPAQRPLDAVHQVGVATRIGPAVLGSPPVGCCCLMATLHIVGSPIFGPKCSISLLEQHSGGPLPAPGECPNG